MYARIAVLGQKKRNSSPILLLIVDMRYTSVAGRNETLASVHEESESKPLLVVNIKTLDYD